MSQSRAMSFLESVANVIVGFSVAVITQVIVFPYFGIKISWAEELYIAGIFTIVSIIRSYFVRRVFNRIHVICLEQNQRS